MFKSVESVTFVKWWTENFVARQAGLITSSVWVGQMLGESVCQSDTVLLKKDHACSVTSTWQAEIVATLSVPVLSSPSPAPGWRMQWQWCGGSSWTWPCGSWPRCAESWADEPSLESVCSSSPPPTAGCSAASAPSPIKCTHKDSFVVQQR